jgi:hypothetical protein
MNDEYGKLVAARHQQVRKELEAFVEEHGTGLSESAKQDVVSTVEASSITVLEAQGSERLIAGEGLDAHIQNLKDEAKMKIHEERSRQKNKGRS